MTQNKHLGFNELKFRILELIFNRHLSAYDVAVLTYRKYSNGAGFRKHYNKIHTTLSRLSKKYDPTMSSRWRGYSIPYATRRQSRQKNPRQAKKDIMLFRASMKGRRMVCEWRALIKQGRDLKWYDRSTSAQHQFCNNNCLYCLSRPEDLI